MGLLRRRFGRRRKPAAGIPTLPGSRGPDPLEVAGELEPRPPCLPRDRLPSAFRPDLSLTSFIRLIYSVGLTHTEVRSHESAARPRVGPLRAGGQARPGARRNP